MLYFLALTKLPPKFDMLGCILRFSKRLGWVLRVFVLLGFRKYMMLGYIRVWKDKSQISCFFLLMRFFEMEADFDLRFKSQEF
jgi:hypothetical protein